MSQQEILTFISFVSILLLIVLFILHDWRIQRQRKKYFNHKNIPIFENLLSDTFRTYNTYFRTFKIVKGYLEKISMTDAKYKELKEDYIAGFLGFIKGSDLEKYLLTARFSTKEQLILFLSIKFDLLISEEILRTNLKAD